MGLRTEWWNIAYRCKDDKTFRVIKNGYKGWYADPFLFEFMDETYLFAEYFSFSLQRGVIVCAKYDEKKQRFSAFRKCIVEDFHMSYPVVFRYNDKIYLMPETSGEKALFLYEAVSFPFEWKRLPAVMTNIRLADTTPIEIGDKLYAVSLKIREEGKVPGDLILLEYNNGTFEISPLGVLTEDMSIARPGGNFIVRDNKLYRVSQDCATGYGNAVNILELSSDFPKGFREELKHKITPHNVHIDIKEVPSGIHTYNINDRVEVIDLKFYRNSFYNLIWKAIYKIKRFKWTQ